MSCLFIILNRPTVRGWILNRHQVSTDGFEAPRCFWAEMRNRSTSPRSFDLKKRCVGLGRFGEDFLIDGPWIPGPHQVLTWNNPIGQKIWSSWIKGGQVGRFWQWLQVRSSCSNLVTLTHLYPFVIFYAWDICTNVHHPDINMLFSHLSTI